MIYERFQNPLQRKPTPSASRRGKFGSLTNDTEFRTLPVAYGMHILHATNPFLIASLDVLKTTEQSRQLKYLQSLR